MRADFLPFTSKIVEHSRDLPFGKPPHEFEILLNWQKTAREDYQKLGAIIIDATQPVEAVVDDILAAECSAAETADYSIASGW